MDGSTKLWLSNLWKIFLLHSPFSLEVLRTQSCISDAMHLLRSMVYIHSPQTQISGVNPSGVSDILTPVLSKLTALFLFRTLTLFNQDQINGPSTSSLINDRDILGDFDAFTLLFHSDFSVPSVLGLALCFHFKINECHLLRDFGLRRFQISISPCSASPREFYPEFVI
jgi:hypothetical protein